MSRDIFIQIVKEKSINDFIFILLVYFLVNLVNLKLFFRILEFNVSFKKILPGILLLVFYNVFGKQIIPNALIYGLILIVLLVIIVKVIGKEAVSWFRAIWGSFLTCFISALGVLCIQFPLWLNKDIANFLEKDTFGFGVGAICEGVFPFISLFLLRMITIPIIPPKTAKRKITLVDVVNLTLFVGLFALLYNAFIRTFKFYFETYSKFDLIKDLLYEGFIVALEIGGYRFIYFTSKKQNELQQKNIELQQKQLKQSEETINELKIRNAELEELNRYLKNRKTTPQRILDDVANLISSNRNITHRLEEFHKSLSSQSESGDIFEYDFITEMAFNELELKIIERIVEGETNAEIAKALGLSTGRIRNIITELLNKTGSRDRTVLAVRYIKSKLRK
ncbi:MAG: LuxR C-terminal-related transcriptional regulator [Firmicutes bacterium]|nr:LuxR C-terminal-related transcriptional regulator [Bacillota bacterium]